MRNVIYENEYLSVLRVLNASNSVVLQLVSDDVNRYSEFICNFFRLLPGDFGVFDAGS